MEYQIKSTDTDINELLDENNLTCEKIIDENYIILANYTMYLKSDLKAKKIEYVDENYRLLTVEDIKECYDMMTDEEKSETYPALQDYINGGLEWNGTLEKIRF